jgi:hydrogenase maturation factor
MCISRVGRIIALTSTGKAKVKLVGSENTLDDVDVSMIASAKKGTFVEIFANLAMGVVTRSEARRRDKLWREITKQSALVNSR